MATHLADPTSALNGWLDENLADTAPATLEELEALVAQVGHSPWLWSHAIRFDLPRRTHRVLYKGPDLEIALFGWAAGQDTTFHDHGGASGAAFICSGLLIEEVLEAAGGQFLAQRTITRRAESAFSFGPDYIHRVRHDPAHGVCLSIHAYTPAVSQPNDYEVLEDGTLSVKLAV
jgi:predicted metal-dependent enzyme (double-stranded beta helix superfamily)